MWGIGYFVTLACTYLKHNIKDVTRETVVGLAYGKVVPLNVFLFINVIKFS